MQRQQVLAISLSTTLPDSPFFESFVLGGLVFEQRKKVINTVCCFCMVVVGGHCQNLASSLLMCCFLYQLTEAQFEDNRGNEVREMERRPWSHNQNLPWVSVYSNLMSSLNHKKKLFSVEFHVLSMDVAGRLPSIAGWLGLIMAHFAKLCSVFFFQKT